MKAARLLAMALCLALALPARSAAADQQRAYPLRLGNQVHFYTRDGQRLPGDGYRSATALYSDNWLERLDPDDIAARMARGGYIVMTVARDPTRKDYLDGYYSAYRYTDRRGTPITEPFREMMAFPFGVLATNYDVDGNPSSTLFDLEGKSLLTDKAYIRSTSVPDRCVVQEANSVDVYRYRDAIARIASIPGRLAETYNIVSDAFWVMNPKTNLAALYDVRTGVRLTDFLYDAPSCQSAPNCYITQRNGAYGALDASGKEIADFAYSYMYMAYGALDVAGLIVDKDGQQGAIGLDGSFLVPLGDYAVTLQNGYWLAMQPDGRSEVYDIAGVAPMPGRLFDGVIPVSVVENGQHRNDRYTIGLVLGDEIHYYQDGKPIDLPQGTTEIDEPTGYIVTARSDGDSSCGFMGKDGTLLVPQIYDAMYFVGDGKDGGMFYAYQYEEQGYRDYQFDITGKPYRGLPTFYERVYDLYVTTLGPYTGLTDDAGRWLVKLTSYANLVD